MRAREHDVCEHRLGSRAGDQQRRVRGELLREQRGEARPPQRGDRHLAAEVRAAVRVRIRVRVCPTTCER